MAATPTAQRFFPFLLWWQRVDRGTLRADAIAGLIGALVVLPQGVAFATLAGLPPQYGLYCAMVPTVVAALFGSSLHAVSGPTNAISLMVLGALAPLAAPGSAPYVSMALTLALLSGLLMLTMGIARLGALVKFISNGVIVGFTTGIGLMIIASQLPALAGVQVERTVAFTEMLHNAIAHANELQPWALATGLLTIASGALVRSRIARANPMIVATLVGTAFAAAVNATLGSGVTGIRTLGAIERALPPLALPELSGATLRNLIGPALALTILSVTQTIAVVRLIAIRSGQRIDSNQEIIGQGLANLLGAFFSAYPSCASVNRCSINHEAGARTPLSAVLSAGFLLVLLAGLAPAAALLPLPAVAGLLAWAGWGLIDFAQIRLYLRTSRQEAAVLVVSLAATLFAPLEYAILVGVIASLVVYLNRTSRPAMRSLAPDPRHTDRSFAPVQDGLVECPQLKILAIEGSIYFGAVEHVETHLDTLREFAPGQKHLLVVARNVNFVDVAGAEALAREARKRRWAGGRLYLQGLRTPVEDVLRNSRLLEEIGAGNAFRAKRAAIGAIFAQLDRGLCASCRARIFRECAALPPPQDEQKNH